MRSLILINPPSSSLLTLLCCLQVRIARTTDKDVHLNAFIFSVEYFYTGLTLLLSALPSTERPRASSIDLTEPVKNYLENVRLCEVRLHAGSGEFVHVCVLCI